MPHTYHVTTTASIRNMWNTENDPWFMSRKRPIIWLCIFTFSDGPWKRNVDKNIAIKIAKLVYNDWSLPKEMDRWSYDKKDKIWTLKDAKIDEISVASWCLKCCRPEILGNDLMYDIKCFKCSLPLKRVGRCIKNKCKVDHHTFVCKNCETWLDRQSSYIGNLNHNIIEKIDDIDSDILNLYIDTTCSPRDIHSRYY